MTGTTRRRDGTCAMTPEAAMEPRADDGDDRCGPSWWLGSWQEPQWSPVLMTGTTRTSQPRRRSSSRPQWSPVLMTGTTSFAQTGRRLRLTPQWSPVLMTGTTRRAGRGSPVPRVAAMEPRADDGDDVGPLGVVVALCAAAMEPRADDGDDDGIADSALPDSRAAMEPRADDGDDLTWVSPTNVRLDAAMEPRADDGDDWPRSPPWEHIVSGRNGAPC